MGVQTEWVDFSICDLTGDTVTYYTKEKMESQFGRFEALELYGEDCINRLSVGKPRTIWFSGYVVVICNYEFLWGEPAIIPVKRNPPNHVPSYLADNTLTPQEVRDYVSYVYECQLPKSGISTIDPEVVSRMGDTIYKLASLLATAYAALDQFHPLGFEYEPLKTARDALYRFAKEWIDYMRPSC